MPYAPEIRPKLLISLVVDGVGDKLGLSSASFALVVEGQEDVVSLRALRPHLSENVGRALRTHQMVIEPIGGAGNLTYKLSLLRTFLCGTHTLLDGDDAGRSVFSKAERDGLVNVANCTFVLCKGFKNAEFEDCIDPVLYRDAIAQEFGVDIDKPQFRGNEKWSVRMKDCFMTQGKDMTEALLGRVKFVVARAVERSPVTALHEYKRTSIDALVQALNAALSKPHLGGA